MMEKNILKYVLGAVFVGIIIGFAIRGQKPSSISTNIEPTTTSTVMIKDTPSTGWDLHIDAEKHFPGNEKMVAHHRCKEVSEMTECQLYDSDDKNARLVGMEIVVDSKTFQAFSSQEKKLWHYHKEEIPKVNAKLPDLSEEEAAKVAKSLEETYGKVYLLWDPSKGDLPIGQPSVTILN